MSLVLERLSGWLLSDPVLRPAPVTTGSGVVNWLNPDGVYDGLYPEIGGYMLQFLAQAASAPERPGRIDPERAQRAARSVVAWLDQAGPAGDPLTLYHRDMAESDWRNLCLFAFDLAIILRGFAQVEARWPGLVSPELMSRYAASAGALVRDSRLASHRLRNGASAVDVPVKWSTTPGVHHVKAAAALAGTGNPAFSALITATLQAEAEALEREGVGRLRELHPFLYTVEGWLTCWGQSGDAVVLARAGMAFTMVLGQLDPEGGVLPPISGHPELPTRADVLAQALRAGLVLEAAGGFDAAAASSWKHARPVLQGALLERLSPEGGVEFDRIGRHRNVWASLFAWQALVVLAQAEAGTLDARTAAAELI